MAGLSADMAQPFHTQAASSSLLLDAIHSIRSLHELGNAAIAPLIDSLRPSIVTISIDHPGQAQLLHQARFTPYAFNTSRNVTMPSNL